MLRPQPGRAPLPYPTFLPASSSNRVTAAVADEVRQRLPGPNREVQLAREQLIERLRGPPARRGARWTSSKPRLR